MRIQTQTHQKNGAARRPRHAAKPCHTGKFQFNLNKILVPVDFSEPSRKALDYAVHFARQFDASILLLHVVDPTPMVTSDPAGGIASILPAQLEATTLRRLTEWVKPIETKLRMPIQAMVRRGKPHIEIGSVAEKNDIDLIIIGRHGRSGLTRFLLGSTTEHVLRHVPCPALVVREREHEFFTESAVRAASVPRRNGNGRHSMRRRSRVNA